LLSKKFRSFTVLQKTLIAFSLLLYAGLLLAQVETRRPWEDEALVANPAWNLANHGSMGTTCWEIIGTNWKDVDRFTYNTLPAGILNLALWFKLFGFSLITARLSSVFWGILLLVSLHRFLVALGSTQAVAIAAALLLAVDYNFILAATFGRVDIMNGALGFAALASYVSLRGNYFRSALLTGSSLVTLSCLTHPNGLAFCAAFVFLVFYLDRRALRINHFVLVALPAFIAAACWVWYVSQDPQAALSQLRANASQSRMTGFLNPWNSISNEVRNRYLTAFGFPQGEHPPGPLKAKVVVLCAYIISVTGVLSNSSLRKTAAVRVLLWLLLILNVYLFFFEAFKFTYYLVLIVPVYDAILAIYLMHLYREGASRRKLAVAVVGLISIVQVGGILLRIKQNQYRRDYLPAVAFLKERAKPQDLVFATSDFGFDYGFERNIKDEFSIGYRSGLDPDYIVMDSNYSGNMMSWQFMQPDTYRFMMDRLRAYRLIYDWNNYKIYSRKH